MKKVIVVGATSGIGQKLAEIMADQRYKVGITGRRHDLLVEMEKKYPESFISCAFDITQTETVTKHLDYLVHNLGGLDMLIISSGTGDINYSLEFGIEKQTIETNVVGFTQVIGWVFNYFEKQKFGHIITITSVAGLRGSRIAPAYNASKAFQINYTEGLRQKAKRSGTDIFVTEVRPGFVKTAMAKADGQFWVSDVEKASEQIYHAILTKQKVAYITKRWSVIGTILKMLPRCIFDRL